MSIEFNCVPLSVSEGRIFFFIFLGSSFFSHSFSIWKHKLLDVEILVCEQPSVCVSCGFVCVFSFAQTKRRVGNKKPRCKRYGPYGQRRRGDRRDKTKMKHVASQRSDFMFSLLFFFRVLWLLLIRSPCSCSCFCLCHYLSLVQCKWWAALFHFAVLALSSTWLSFFISCQLPLSAPITNALYVLSLLSLCKRATCILLVWASCFSSAHTHTHTRLVFAKAQDFQVQILVEIQIHVTHQNTQYFARHVTHISSIESHCTAEQLS